MYIRLFLMMLFFNGLHLSQVFGYGLNRSKTGQIIKWQRFPITLSVDSVGMGQYFQNNPLRGQEGSEFDAFEKAIIPWNRASCRGKKSNLLFESLGRIEEQKVGFDRECQECNQNLVHFVKVKSEWRHDQTLLAATINTFSDDGEILDSDIEINAAFFEWSTQIDDPENMYWDLQNTLTHEIGHVIGLAHREVERATMYAEGYIKEVQKRDLDQDDVFGACVLYSSDKMDVPLYEQESIDRALGCSMFSSKGNDFFLFLMGVMSVLFLFWSKRPFIRTH